MAIAKTRNYFSIDIDIINWRGAQGAAFDKQELETRTQTENKPETIVNKIQNADTKIQSSSSEFLSLSRHVDASSEAKV